jgi:hypothetical protein
MSFITSQHHQAFENFWVSNSGAIQVGVTADNLAPQGIGFFDCGANCAEENLSVSMPNIKKTKRMKIKQGIVKLNDFQYISRQSNNPLETHCFTAADIVSFSGTKSDIPNKGNWKQQKIALGYDGFDASKSLNAKLDAKPISFTFILQGDPIQRYFGENQISYEFSVNKDMCLGDCDCFDACGKVSCNTITENLKKAMQFPLPKVLKSGAVVKRPITDFININTITKCNPVTPPVAQILVEYSKWSISICDDGATNISRLAAAYPLAKISQESRSEGITTYSFWQPTTAPDPVDFTLSKHVLPICGSCPTCPEVYTPVAGTKAIQVRVACGAAAPVVPGAITTELVASSLSGGDAYIVTVPTTTTDVAIETALTGCVEFAILNEQGPSCVGTDVTFSWSSCEICNKTEKEYMIVLSDKDCPAGDHLAELQAAYPTLVIAAGQAGSCAHSYLTTVQSDCVKPSEDCLITDEFYSFTAPVPFKGKMWENSTTIQLDPNCTIVPEVDDCCVCGIVVEGKAFHRETLAECTPGILEHNPGDLLGVRVHVTAQTWDPTGNPCDATKEYITILQNEKIPMGTPGSLLIKYERSRLAYENKLYSGNHYLDQANGFNIVAKVGTWYDNYRLVLRGKLNYDENRLMKGVDDIAYNFYFASGTGKDFETQMNSLILSAGNPELNAVIL